MQYSFIFTLVLIIHIFKIRLNLVIEEEMFCFKEIIPASFLSQQAPVKKIQLCLQNLLFHYQTSNVTKFKGWNTNLGILDGENSMRPTAGIVDMSGCCNPVSSEKTLIKYTKQNAS